MLKNFKNSLLTGVESTKSKVEKNSLYLGVVKGYTTPTLPKKVELFYSNIYIRIFRFIGGICLFLILTKLHLALPFLSQIIILILGSIQCFQILIIFIIKSIYSIYTLKYKSKDLASKVHDK